ncbi:MAG: DUF262 domain-containing protein, partial [Candidatus Limisoma sp.]
MATKHTLYTLCQTYNKVEIPIIQRDYAQGRKGQDNLRNKFVDYLLSSLKAKSAIELDFIYGEVRLDVAKDGKTELETFIPIDGQQRLTTLWLLHWFLSVQEGRLAEMKDILSKFTYETRPTTHDFCYHLTSNIFPKESLTDIDKYIQERAWFDPEWMNDSSIRGMLRMLHTFAISPILSAGDIKLDQLLQPNNMISFYFEPLHNFGPSEELYIRMNARGKILTRFENFKSEFYKILKGNQRLDEVKDKMEYAWVSNLWPYLNKEVYVTDECFMNFLQFVTRMLYFEEAEARSDKGYESDFTNFKLLNKIYSQNKNTDFLIFAIDKIPFLAEQKDFPKLWTDNNKKLAFSDILSKCIKGEHMSVERMFVLYSALIYAYKHQREIPTTEGKINSNPFCVRMNDFVRVIRNLIVNTKDNSEREHPRIIKSIVTLCEIDDFYAKIREDGFNLKGLNNSQCAEESIKAKIIQKYPGVKDLIHEIEDNHCFKGNILSIIAAVYTNKEEEIKDFSFNEAHLNSFNANRLQTIYNTYKQLAKNYFESVWGDLLNSSLYTHLVSAARLVYDRNYAKNPAIIAITTKFAFDKFGLLELDEFLQNNEKKFVRELVSKYENISQIRDVKIQLQLLYILCTRILGCKISDFFASNCYNFGWLQK